MPSPSSPPSSPQQQPQQPQPQQQQNRPSIRAGGNGRRATYDRVSFAENHVSVVSYDEGGDDEDQDRLGRGGEGRVESASSPPPHDAAPSVRSSSSSSSATTLSSSAGARRNRSLGSLRASSSVSVSSSSSSLERGREESLPLAPSPSLSPSSSMLCGERERSGSHGMGAGERRKGGGGLSGATAATSTTTNSKVPPILERINVVILDAAHAKFNVAADPSWTVKQFKIAGYGQHRVPSRMQRLIYMGRLLRDEDTLRDSGLVETDKIVHLFPKPNVVVQKGRRRGGKGGADDDDDDDDEEKAGMTMIVPSPPGGRADGAGGADAGGSGTLSAGGGAAAAATTITAGAHVPRIVLDAAEAERRSQILILSSAEVFEAQHRVKLLSFLLLVISSMELLTLFTIMLGVPSAAAPYDDDTYPPLDPTDTGPRGGHGGNGGNDEDGYGNQVRPWRTSDYFDLAVSSFGFYVATLGIKAATENSSRAARKYVYSLVACGVAWNAYYYYLSYRDLRDEAEDQRDAAPASSGGGAGGGNEGQQQQQQQNLDGPDLYTQAFFSILLPIFVWLICFVRAFQFRQLIEEAEAEAEERTRSFARNLNGEDSDDDDDDDDGDDDEDEDDHIEDDRRGLHGNDVFGENDEGRAAASPSSSSGSSYSMTASAREGSGRGGGGGWTRAIPYGMVGGGEGVSLAGGTTTRRSAMDDLDSLELRVQAEGRMLT